MRFLIFFFIAPITISVVLFQGKVMATCSYKFRDGGTCTPCGSTVSAGCMTTICANGAYGPNCCAHEGYLSDWTPCANDAY
jgi:hypothetical protein